MFVIRVRFEIKIFVNISVIQIAYINDTTQFNICGAIGSTILLKD